MNQITRSNRSQSNSGTATLFTTLLTILLFTAGFAGGAWAQEDEGERTIDDEAGRYSTVENITVTAERRETQLEKTPVSVTAFTPRTIEELDIKNVVNMAEFTPNLNIHTNAGGNTGSTIGIRGAITSDPVFSLEPTVGIYLNGVYIGKSVGSLFDLPDLQGIEVLRGPQGTLYGRNTVGGAITLNTIKPSGDWGLRQSFRAGNFRAFRTQTSLDIPVLGGEKGLATPDWLGTMNARITYQFEKRDGFYNNSADQYAMPNLGFPTNPLAGTQLEPGSNRLDDLNREAALITVDWDLPYEIELDYVWDHHHVREVPTAFQTTYQYPGGGVPGFLGLDLSPWASNDRLSDIPNQQFQNTQLESGDLTSELDINGHAITLSRSQELGFMGDEELKGIVGIRELHNVDAVDYDGSPYHIQDFGLDIQQDTVSFEADWIGSKDWGDAGNFDYIVGLFYYQEDGSTINSLLSFGFLGGIPGADTSFGAAATESSFWFDNYSVAPFGQVTWTMPWWEDRLSLTAGARYTYENKQMTREYDCILNPPTPPAVVGNCPAPGTDGGDFRATQEEDFDHWSPMVNLTVQATDDIMVYARVANGFKSGGFNGRASTLAAFEQSYKSETLWSYEGGIKATWWERRILTNLSGFYSDYDDMQVTVFQPTDDGIPTTSIFNAAEAGIGGLEFESVFVPIEGLNLRLAYAYLHTEYKKFIDAGVDVSDDRNFVLAPEHTITAGAGYTLPPFSFGTLSARLDVYWQDAVKFSVDNPSGRNQEKSYTTLSGRVELAEISLWDYGTAAVAIWGRNLTDTEYKTFGIDWTQPVGNVTSSFGRPRHYGFDVTFNF